MNSYFPKCVKSWNNIGEELRSSNTISKFKKDSYGIPNHIGIKSIFRLRLGLLKCHKKSHSFLDTHYELCDCQQAFIFF